MAEGITVLGIVAKLEEAVARFQKTGDKSSLKGTFSWAKGVAKKIDGGEVDAKKDVALSSEVVTDEGPKESGASLEDEEELPILSLDEDFEDDEDE